MHNLLTEAARMPAGSVGFARGVGEVRTPDHLVPLRDRVRTQHGGDLRRVHAAIEQRFGTTGATDDYINVFYAASEMAVMVEVGREELPADDRQLLRQLWDRLLAA